MSTADTQHLDEGWEEMWSTDTDLLERVAVDGGHLWRSTRTKSGTSHEPLMMAVVFVPFSEEELTPDV
jgi:hypothetical protein